MNKLRADSYRAASHLAVAGISLLVFASGAWGQATYSSPVRVTNAEAAPVYVAPAGGKMTVTAPSASPLPVTMSGTLPVAQQGTVTVAPSGGQMPVTGTVALSGTPTVALSTTGNTVNLGGTPIVRSGFWTFSGGPLVAQLGDFPNAVEADMVTFFCKVDKGYKIAQPYLVMKTPEGSWPRIPFVPIIGTPADAVKDHWAGAMTGKVYIPAGTTMLQFYMGLPEPTSGDCFLYLSGRMH